jgi:hypothetical protein
MFLLQFPGKNILKPQKLFFGKTILKNYVYITRLYDASEDRKNYNHPPNLPVSLL